MQVKLNEGKLLNAFGNLSEFGYETSFVKDYDRRDIRINKLKVKESNFYCFGNIRYGICIEVADYSTYGYAVISVIDFEKNNCIYKKVRRFMTNGKVALPKSTKNGGFVFNYKDLNLKISNDGIKQNILCKLDKFDGVADFECDIDLQLSNRESLVTVIPYKNKKQFRYSQFIPSIKIRGMARVGGRKLSFSEMDSFGVIKWVRSLLPYKDGYINAVMSGIKNGKHIAFNFMSDIGTSLNVTENMLFYDNKTYKLEHINFDIPTNEKGKPMIMEKWNITSSDKLINLTFNPVIRSKRKNNFVIINHTTNYLFGYFSGNIVLNDKEIHIENLVGHIDITKMRG